MNKIKNVIIIISIIMHVQVIQGDEDLIELNCANETQCKQFEHSGINASCIEEQCRCAGSNGESVRCQPPNSKINNFIGGSCPCKMRNAVCNEPQNICYCVSEFVPSEDKRRCIPKKVELNEKCEETSQCQGVNYNAICHKSKTCRCMEHFVSDDDVCVSVLGNTSVSWNGTKCDKFGDNTRYSRKNKQCICKRGYIASNEHSICLKVAKYLETCRESLQCIGTMGVGGVCGENNTCTCEDKYFVEEKNNTNDVIQSVCTPVAERGQYCRYDEDCYQHQLSDSEQTMYCNYGECNCKGGFNSLNDTACMPASGAGFKSIISLLIIFIINIIYSTF